LGSQTGVIATGGQGQMITRSSRFVKVYDENLTLDGLRLIWGRNAHA
jgi:pantothenate kinase type III